MKSTELDTVGARTPRRRTAALRVIAIVGIAGAMSFGGSQVAQAAPQAVAASQSIATAVDDTARTGTWQTFETNISSEGACESLLQRMRAAYPGTFGWECLPYTTSTCPPAEKWELLYIDHSGARMGEETAPAASTQPAAAKC